MNWIELWMKLFGTTELLGLDMGFWVSMSAVTVLVAAMNVVFWGMKPKTDAGNEPKSRESAPPEA